MSNVLKLFLSQLVFITFIGLTQAEESKSFPKKVNHSALQV